MNDQAEHLSGILPHHLIRLRMSTLVDVTITAAGIRSETSPEALATMLNQSKPRKGLAPAIVIPYVDANGQNGYCRLRPDTPRTLKGKPVKYESPREQPNRVYIPPGVAAVLDDPAIELCITEGEFKALAIRQAGPACIGLVGVFGWKAKGREQLLPELQRVKWTGRQVVIVFDSDITDKPDVALAESRLAKHLTDRGAIVRCVRLPDGAPGDDGQPTKLGADDYLLTHSPAEFRKLLDSAIEPEIIVGPNTKEDAGKIDPSTEAKAYVDALTFDDIPRLRYWHGVPWIWISGAYREREPAEVRADLINQLDRTYRNLGSGVVSCVLDHIKARTILASTVESGTWLDGSPRGWKPEDILATRKQIIHLPTLVAGNQDFAQPATPRLFVTAAIEFDFDQQAPRPDAWLNFLDQVWASDNHAIETLQDWIGYLLTPDTTQHKIALLVGPPRSGKGTIARVIRELVGHRNVCGPTLASLGTPFGLWPLWGKSVAIISDARLSGRTDTAVVLERLLSISGEDAQLIDGKYRDAFTAKLSTRLMILTNELPRLADSSGAAASRFIVLRLQESFLGKEDPRLFEKLKPELPAILIWALGGWQRLRERGRFIQPASGRELAQEMADLTSPVAVFIRERCAIGPECIVPRKLLHESYREWCEEKGRSYVEDDAGFGRALRAALPSLRDHQPRVDGVKVRHYAGLRLAV
mgnify:CR=1 FL=1